MPAPGKLEKVRLAVLLIVLPAAAVFETTALIVIVAVAPGLRHVTVAVAFGAE